MGHPDNSGRGVDRWTGASRLSRLTVGMIGATTVLHSVAGLAQPEWREILRRGVWNTVAEEDDAAMATMWFTVSGAALGGIGLLAGRSTRDDGVIPPDLPWLLFGLGVPIVILQPASGGWLVLIAGGAALAARCADDQDARLDCGRRPSRSVSRRDVARSRRSGRRRSGQARGRAMHRSPRR